MTYREMREIVSFITYKPYHQIVLVDKGGLFAIQVQARVPSAIPPYETIRVILERNVPTLVTVQEFLLFVRDVVRDFEMHEVDEYLQFNRIHVVNPHP